MSPSAPQPLCLDEVRHVAKLARLRLDDAQLDSYRGQLTSILDHISHLAELDVADVEPLAHPGGQVNRFRDDEVTVAMPVTRLLEMAPETEEAFIAVPKVLGGE
jgi:aspartyl-tRNA(Asn)/glutamyl-tRNA(Gln) amidotransferase subunit C